MLDVGKGTVLLADRGYDSDAIRQKLDEQGARANIRPLEHRIVKPKFSQKAYRRRNLVERFFNKLKHYRAIATLILPPRHQLSGLSPTCCATHLVEV